MNNVFWMLAAVTVLGAVMAVTLRNLVHGVLSLILFFLGIAGHYFLLRAEFLGIAQILIYIGAVAILILFAVMLTRNVTGTVGPAEPLGGQWWVGFGVAAALAVIVIVSLNQAATGLLLPTGTPTASVAAIGTQFVTTSVVAFELMGVLLTAALIGAVVIALEEAGRPQ